MPVKNREEIFVRLISHVRQGTERTASHASPSRLGCGRDHLADTSQRRRGTRQTELAKGLAPSIQIHLSGGNRAF
jgi:hypothetical protein